MHHSASKTSHLKIEKQQSSQSKMITSQTGILKRSSITLASGSSSGFSSIKKNVSERNSTKHHFPLIKDGAVDITPRNLCIPDSNKKKHALTEGVQAGESLFLQSVYSIHQGSKKHPQYRSLYGSTSSMTDTQFSYQDSFEEDLTVNVRPVEFSAGEIEFIKLEDEEIITPEDLEKLVEVTLNETDTIWILDIPPTVVSTESDEATLVRETNEKYLELKKDKEGNDRFIGRGMQTFNHPIKEKSLQTVNIGSQSIGIMTTNWDIYDEFERQKVFEEEEAEMATSVIPSLTTSKVSSRAVSKQTDRQSLHSSRTASVLDKRATPGPANSLSQLSSTLVDSSFLDSTSGNLDKSLLTIANVGSSDSTQLFKREADAIFNSESLKESLALMERAIVMNIYQPKQALYRDIYIDSEVKDSEPLKDAVPDSIDYDQLHVSDQLMRPRTSERKRRLEIVSPTLDLLWVYKCNLTDGYIPLCFEFNKQIPDIIAVGYINTQIDSENTYSGLICCWSIKNLEYPERWYKTHYGVTSLSFSSIHTSILAAGLLNGVIVIYNIRKRDPEPSIESSGCPSKHTSAVWQVEWVERETVSGEEKSEFLVSSSADGRISQWTIRKGFESTDLMYLKRTSTSSDSDTKMPTKNRQFSAFISRFTPGLAFAFTKDSSNIYLAGTEDGKVHKCSCSYTEQYLKSYDGHTGPVNRIRCHPNLSNYFLTCSPDWSIRLWQESSTASLLTFTHSQEPLVDIQWSPKRPTLFASITESSLQIWDISVSVLDPVYSANPTTNSCGISSLAFAINSECILIGDTAGRVHVLKMCSMPPIQSKTALIEMFEESSAPDEVF